MTPSPKPSPRIPFATLLATLALTTLASLAVAQESRTVPESTNSGISIAPPTTLPAPGLKIETPAEALMPLRANQTYTTNALIGYVNSQPVFVGDVLRPLHEELTRLAAQPSQTLSGFRKEARAMIDGQIKRQINDLLIQQAARAALTDEDKQRIDTYINKMRFDTLTKYGGSQALADQALRAVGSSVEKEMADRRRRLTVDLYLSKQLLPRIIVTRAMVLDEYEKSLKKYTVDPEIELYTITIPVSRFLQETGNDGDKVTIKNPTPEQIKKAELDANLQAQTVLEEAKKGADWAILAEKYSADGRKYQGGRTAKVRKGSLAVEALEKAAFELPADTMAPPLVVLDKDVKKSFIILYKVGNKKEARVIPFSEAQDEIRAKLRESQYNQLTNDYLAKLYRDAAVESVTIMIDVALDAAVSRYATQAR